MNLGLSCSIMNDIKPFEITFAIVSGIILLFQIYYMGKNMSNYYYFDKLFDLQNKRVKYLIVGLLILRISQSISIGLLKKNTLYSSIIILIV
jgi:hypothetical protein